VPDEVTSISCPAWPVLSQDEAMSHLIGSAVVVRKALCEADLDAEVPTCPGWVLRDLVRHVGGLHRWVVGAIKEGHPDTPTPDGPHQRGDLLEWWNEGWSDFLHVLATAAPDAPAWHFGPKPRTVSWWYRRQAHEHAIHAWDAVLAARWRPPADVPFEPRFALDGVDEIVTMFFPRQVRLGRTPPLAGSLALRSDDGPEHAWVLSGDGTQPVAVEAADAVLDAPAWLLYLVLWKRQPLDHPLLRITGDRAAAEQVLTAAITP